MNAFGGFARWGIFGLAGYAVVAQAVLALGGRVPPWLFPIALGVALVGLTRAPKTAIVSTRVDLAAVALVALVLVALCYGSFATPSREWDGYVAWGLKAKVLNAAPDLRTAFFTDPLVDAHSRNYPILQPLCQASLASLLGDAGGRLLFPGLWIVLCGLAARTLAPFQLPPLWRAAGWLGAALMPGFVTTGGGAVDSGYAELFVATALTGVACGLLTRDVPLVVAGTILVALVKPEGPAYAGLVILALLAARHSRLRLVFATLIFLTYAAGVLLADIMAHSNVALHRLTGACGGEIVNLISAKRFGITWMLLIPLALCPRRFVGPCPSPALGYLVFGGLLIAPVPFVLWPDITIEHHLRSSMPRLLLHWVVPAWLLAVAWVAPFHLSSATPAVQSEHAA